MTADDYTVVFDISTQRLNLWDLILWPGLLFAAMAITAAVSQRSDVRAAAAIAAGASLILLAGWIGLGVLSLNRLQDAYARQDFILVEGAVREFRPDMHDGQRFQSFYVSEHYFAVRPSSIGFDQTVERGGPDLSGKCVRIAFIEPNEILWLGIKRSVCEPAG